MHVIPMIGMRTSMRPLLSKKPLSLTLRPKGTQRENSKRF